VTEPDAGASRGKTAQAISNSVVRLMREYTGRGPTQAQTTINNNLVIVILRDTLLKAEKSLISDGQGEAAVTAHTGRVVEAFLSDNAIDPDVAVEIFILRPRELETDQG
jgi:uncharacterized protein YbcI